VVKKTVEYASALAVLYAVVPTARIESVKPGTPVKLPVVKPCKKAVTEEAGLPAAMTAGGTMAGTVAVRQLDSTGDDDHGVIDTVPKISSRCSTGHMSYQPGSQTQQDAGRNPAEVLKKINR